MSYERPAFGTGKTRKALSAFGKMPAPLPSFDYPIPIKENFYRAMRHEHPMWVPLPAAEMQELHMAHLSGKGPEGYQLGPDLAATQERYQYKDAFGNSWTFDKNAGGACMTIGTRVCDDILKWEEQIHFPDLHEWDMAGRAAQFMAEEYDPERILHLDIYHGPFQALSDLLGGFAEALEAMILEPEACRAFFDRFTDWMIWLIDKLSALYPVDMFTIHDDWGTERDTFFSPSMMEELLFEPTKKMIDHVHSLGKLYQFHCCGKIDRFMPAMCELGPELMQIQRRVNDTPEYKRLYGDRIGFNAGFEGFAFGKKYSHDELVALVRENVDLYAPTGGWLPAIFGLPPEMMWDVAAELYAYSREKYDEENA